MPGATGSPVVRSHTTVDARWLAIADAVDGPAVVERTTGELEHDAAHRGCVELDEPGRR